MRFQRILTADGPAAILFVRLLVGGVFFLEGIKKFFFESAIGRFSLARLAIIS